jgi:CRP/FNR family cyclic AMP-dependent transcriptional regulator
VSDRRAGSEGGRQAPRPAGGSWLPSGDQAALFADARKRTFKRQDKLIHQGDDSDDVFLIRSGHVKVSVMKHGVEGVLAFRGPGDIVGEQSALDGGSRSASVVALEAVLATVVTGADFNAFLDRTPSANHAIRRELSLRLREAAVKRGEFGRLGATGRLASGLLELARPDDRDEGVLVVSIPLSHEDLAAWIGASVQSVERALRVMRRPGWIETGRRNIRILDARSVRSLTA